MEHDFPHGVCYAGTWVCEGHTLTFEIHDDDTVTIREYYTAQGDEVTSHQRVDLDKAITYQEKYIKLGYDKIS